MKMPDLATNDTTIKLVEWRVQPGQAVKPGDVVLEVETDKATMEVEATVTGVLRETRFARGDEMLPGDIIAIIETAGTAPTPAPAATPAVSPAPAPTAQPALRPAGQGESLFARNRRAAQAADAPAAGTPLSPARRAAARRLAESKQHIPHFYLHASARADALVARRAAAGSPAPAWDAYFVQAAAAALAQFPQMAGRFEADRIVPADNPRIGVAVDIDNDLFIVPVEDPRTKDVAAISRDIRAGVDALKRGDVGATALRPGVMTITNLGGERIDSFDAIINPPESCILALGRIHQAVVADDGAPRVAWTVSLSLAVDHRVVNGRYAARFLGAIVAELEKS
ncbi:MAG: 2-oxo acid dehydrogenase subunit E2 [Opitutaceae bacterium]|nr:2-oxo acid dehydrogenase subunit E2 [Opitutaceae bacterium]